MGGATKASTKTSPKASPKAMAVTKKDMDSNKNNMEYTKKGKKTEKKEE